VEGFDELVLLELRLRILVFWARHIDGYVYHSQIGVAEAGI
jgi:hypothetical protein